MKWRPAAQLTTGDLLDLLLNSSVQPSRYDRRNLVIVLERLNNCRHPPHLPNRQRRSGGSEPLRSRAAPVDFKSTGFTTVTEQQRTTTLFRPGSNTSLPSDLQLALRATQNSAWNPPRRTIVGPIALQFESTMPRLRPPFSHRLPAFRSFRPMKQLLHVFSRFWDSDVDEFFRDLGPVWRFRR